MIESPEDKYIRELIETHTRPLKADIKKLQDTQNMDCESLFQSILKRTPLFTRFKVFLEMQHLTLMIQPDREATDQEWKAAHEWAEKTTSYMMTQFARWERDGRPEPLPKKED